MRIDNSPETTRLIAFQGAPDKAVSNKVENDNNRSGTAQSINKNIVAID